MYLYVYMYVFHKLHLIEYIYISFMIDSSIVIAIIGDTVTLK